MAKAKMDHGLVGSKCFWFATKGSGAEVEHDNIVIMWDKSYIANLDTNGRKWTCDFCKVSECKDPDGDKIGGTTFNDPISELLVNGSIPTTMGGISEKELAKFNLGEICAGNGLVEFPISESAKIFSSSLSSKIYFSNGTNGTTDTDIAPVFGSNEEALEEDNEELKSYILLKALVINETVPIMRKLIPESESTESLYWYWSVSSESGSDTMWDENFSDKIRVSKVRILKASGNNSDTGANECRPEMNGYMEVQDDYILSVDFIKPWWGKFIPNSPSRNNSAPDCHLGGERELLLPGNCRDKHGNVLDEQYEEYVNVTPAYKRSDKEDISWLVKFTEPVEKTENLIIEFTLEVD